MMSGSKHYAFFFFSFCFFVFLFCFVFFYSCSHAFLSFFQVAKECTVWFWKFIPDPIIFALGILFLLPGLPLFASLIGGSEIVFFGLVRLVNIFPFLGTVPSLVFDLGAKLGSPFMKVFFCFVTSLD